MKKGGQISVFIIIGMVIVAGIGIATLFLNRPLANDPSIQPVSSLVNNYMQECIEKTTEDGIRYVSSQGGYFDIPEPNAEYGFFKVPYYFNLGKTNIPSKNDIGKEIIRFMKQEIPKCNEDIPYFESQGYALKFGVLDIDVELGKQIIIDVDYPITITKENKSVVIKRFENTLDFNFDRVYKFINEIATEQKKDPDFVPIGYISLLAKKNDFKFDLIYTENTNVIYSLLFPNAFGKDTTLMYNFGGRYKWSKPEERKVLIEEIPYLRAYEEKEFTYQVKTSGENVQFEDFSDLFDISNDGKIKFTPKVEDSGVYEILIRASDGYGNEDYQVMTLDIGKDIGGLNLSGVKVS